MRREKLRERAKLDEKLYINEQKIQRKVNLWYALSERNEERAKSDEKLNINERK